MMRLPTLSYIKREEIMLHADNADHNVRTLNGIATFHGMGIIAALTPGMKQTRSVQRISATAEDVAALAKSDIQYFNKPLNSILSMVYCPLSISYKDSTWKLDLLWKVTLPIRSPRSGCSGMMQATNQGNHPGKSSVTLLPMVDMDPSDMNCVYSTLKYVAKEARHHDVTPVLTFYQPLWWKAQLIIARDELPNSFLRNIVQRLGGFHSEWVFLVALVISWQDLAYKSC